jgi:hypothetical protein
MFDLKYSRSIPSWEGFFSETATADEHDGKNKLFFCALRFTPDGNAKCSGCGGLQRMQAGTLSIETVGGSELV